MYVAFVVVWLSGGVPWYVAAPIFRVLTTFAGMGHYFMVRPWQVDMNITMALTAVDGHNLHHGFIGNLRDGPLSPFPRSSGRQSRRCPCCPSLTEPF